MSHATVTWIPPMDLYESGGDYVLTAEVPGVARRDIKVEFSGCKIKIRGQRRFDEICRRECYHRLEGHRGRFERTFALPEPVDRRGFKLQLRDGLLHLVLPKSGRGGGRKSHG